MKLQLLKGTTDSSFDEQLTKTKVIEIITRYFRRYGYTPLETPILEPYDILASKYAGGSEILKETYSLSDQGERKIALRYDLTVPFARFIGMNPHLKQPIKRYEIGKSFRDGPVKTGRKREFTQCDCDCVGIKQMTVDAEQILLALDVFHELGLDAYIEVNNRKLLAGIIEHCSIPESMISSVILTVDKIKKISRAQFVSELTEKGLTEGQIEALLAMVTRLNSIKEEFYSEQITLEECITKLEAVSEQPAYQEGVTELQELFHFIISYGKGEQEIRRRIKINFGLARGLEIYTSTVFEGFLTDGSISSSLCGGGRWDKIIGQFLESSQQYPAVGISFGLDVLYEALRKQETDQKLTTTDVYIIPIKEKERVLSLVSFLRSKGISSDVDQMNRNLSKNLDYADKLGIPYVVIAGPQEFEKGTFKLRDMGSGEEAFYTKEELVTTLQEKLGN